MNRPLGNTGRTLHPIGLGCMGMSWGYAESTRNDTSAIEVIRTAIDLGVTMIDTALVYGDGHNEHLVGRALAGIRDGVTVATKGGLIVEDLATKSMRRNGTPTNLHLQIDESLRRLQIDTIDLYYLHRVDENVPLDDSWGALADAVQAGKIRWLGLSEVTLAQAAQAHAQHPVTAIQSELSLWTRGPLGSDEQAEDNAVAAHGGAAATTNEDIVGWTMSNDVSFLPFAPLGRGFLTGEVTASTHLDATDFRASNPRFQAEAMLRNEVITDAVAEVAKRNDASAAQIAIAWVLAQSPNIVPIPGTRSEAHLVDNLGAANVELDKSDMDRLDALPAAFGSRY